MSYAVIEIGGGQRKVSPGDTIRVDRIASGATAEGAELSLDRVLMVKDGDTVRLGTPLVEGAVVRAKVLGQVKGKKILVFKKKRRKQYRRTRGHRQQFTTLRIEGIEAGG